jgi:hypothetical protein
VSTYAELRQQILELGYRPPDHRQLVARSDKLLSLVEQENLRAYAHLPGRGRQLLAVDMEPVPLPPAMASAINQLLADVALPPRPLPITRDALAAIYHAQAVLLGSGDDTAEDDLEEG